VGPMWHMHGARAWTRAAHAHAPQWQLGAPHWPQHPTPRTLQAFRTKVRAMWPGGALQPPWGALNLVVSEYASFAVARAVLAQISKFRLQEFETAPEQIIKHLRGLTPSFSETQYVADVGV
jgi:hypothetical protein